MLLEITYAYGRGHAKIDMEKVIPCSAADMKRIISIVNMAADPEESAKIIYDFISDKVEQLKAGRAKIDKNSADGKETITAINRELKKYLSNAAALVKQFGFPEMTDNAAQIVYRPATVYAIVSTSAVCSVKPFEGWCFEKEGFTFDIRKETNGRKSSYIIMLHGTGLQVAETTAKNKADAEITPRILDVLRRGADKIRAAKEKHNELMVAAGYMEPGPKKQAETISTKEQAETISTKEQAETISTQEETPADNPKQARGPVPEKTFIGETIQGNGWKIIFDGTTNRTRVILSGGQDSKYKELAESFGFYYSANMNSWNKKLTFKAYRAALKLAETLAKESGMKECPQAYKIA